MATSALARKFRVDVTSDLTLATGWTQVKGISALKPAVDPNLVETSSYDAAGWDSFEVTGNAWSLQATFWRRFPSGVYDVGQELLRARIAMFGDSARVGVRWYDTGGSTEAYQGVAIVKWERAQDGVKDVDAATVTLTGDGALATITNPGTAPVAPVIISALPSGVAAAGLVTITGSNFTGTIPTTGVKFGGVNATTWSVVSDSVIVATMPAGSAGSAVVLVTNAVGASSAFPYTRA